LQQDTRVRGVMENVNEYDRVVTFVRARDRTAVERTHRYQRFGTREKVDSLNREVTPPRHDSLIN